MQQRVNIFCYVHYSEIILKTTNSYINIAVNTFTVECRPTVSLRFVNYDLAIINYRYQSSIINYPYYFCLLEPPWFPEHSRHVQVEVGATTSLSCRARGDPPLTLRWIREGVHLHSNPRYEKSIGSSSLKPEVREINWFIFPQTRGTRNQLVHLPSNPRYESTMGYRSSNPRYESRMGLSFFKTEVRVNNEFIVPQN